MARETTFRSWMAELRRYAAKYSRAIAQSLNNSDWRENYNDGLTPREAFDEDMRYGD